ncbi:MAG: response regulator [Bacteroidota bacterium]
MKNVLLVDDDQICNLLSSKTLERMGFAEGIQTALNGKEAINLLNAFLQNSHAMPDVILLDLNMPIMDGFDFLEAFKKLNLPHKENVKIIIVTSSSSPNDMFKAKQLGVDHYLTKPLSEEGLRRVLDARN